MTITGPPSPPRMPWVAPYAFRIDLDREGLAVRWKVRAVRMRPGMDEPEYTAIGNPLGYENPVHAAEVLRDYLDLEMIPF